MLANKILVVHLPLKYSVNNYVLLIAFKLTEINELNVHEAHKTLSRVFSFPSVPLRKGHVTNAISIHFFTRKANRKRNRKIDSNDQLNCNDFQIFIFSTYTATFFSLFLSFFLFSFEKGKRRSSP